MDTRQQTLTSLVQLVSEQLGIKPAAITPVATWTQLGADSLDRIAISLAIEDLFRLDLPHQVGERLNTVGDTLDYLCGLIRVRSEPYDNAKLCDDSPAPQVRAVTREHTNVPGAELGSKQQLFNHLREVICDQLDERPDSIHLSATWLQLGADSLDRLAISLAIEDTYQVDIPHQIGERLNTVSDTVDYVWELMSAKFANIETDRSTLLIPAAAFVNS